MLEEPSSTSPSKWHIIHSSKLQILLKLRRFFHHSKKPTKKQPLSLPSNTFTSYNNNITSKNDVILESKNEVKEELHEQEDKSSQVRLQRAVKELLFGTWEERDSGAKQIIERLTCEDVQMRKTLGELGVIPPLVSMVDSKVVSRRLLAIHALTKLSDGTFTNKALILEAGILSKLPADIDETDEQTKHDLSQLLLSISSLSNTQFPFNPSKLLPFILNILHSKSTTEATKAACLGTLHNLSSVLENSAPLISNQVVEILLNLLSTSREKTSELALSTVGNLVVTLMGRKALEDNALVPESLIDILTWEDKPKCQELSAYVLMILAHQSSKQRHKMAKAGIVHVLLEVALLGSPLAQKRALKIMQWFKDQNQVRVGPHSGPLARNVSMGSPLHEREVSEGKRLMKKMVQQSLHKNMEVITRRANSSGQSAKLKSLVISSSSKSLPY